MLGGNVYCESRNFCDRIILKYWGMHSEWRQITYMTLKPHIANIIVQGRPLMMLGRRGRKIENDFFPWDVPSKFLSWGPLHFFSPPPSDLTPVRFTIHENTLYMNMWYELTKRCNMRPKTSFLSPPVPMHGGLLCITFCLSVRKIQTRI